LLYTLIQLINPDILAMGILSTMPFFNHGDFEVL